MAGMPAAVEGACIIRRALLGLATVARQTWSAKAHADIVYVFIPGTAGSAP
jgi:hypothetical protein